VSTSAPSEVPACNSVERERSQCVSRCEAPALSRSTKTSVSKLNVEGERLASCILDVDGDFFYYQNGRENHMSLIRSKEWSDSEYWVLLHAQVSCFNPVFTDGGMILTSVA